MAFSRFVAGNQNLTKEFKMKNWVFNLWYSHTNYNFGKVADRTVYFYGTKEEADNKYYAFLSFYRVVQYIAK